MKAISLGYDLEDKVVIVTGASSGIGLSAAAHFAAAGAYVVLISRSKENLERARGEIIKSFPQAKVEILPCDMADRSGFSEALKERLQEWKRIDVLVNNAGITRDGLLISMTDEDWESVIETNLNASFRAMRSVAKIMLKQRSGSIVNISSVTGLMGNKGQTNYSAAKAGLIALTRSLAKELGSRGIRVNAVAPGFIETKMTEKIAPALVEQYKTVIPLGRFGYSEEAAKAIVFLGSPALSSYITGQVLVVDGGLLMA